MENGDDLDCIKMVLSCSNLTLGLILDSSTLLLSQRISIIVSFIASVEVSFCSVRQVLSKKNSAAPWFNQAKTPVDRCQETRKQNISVQPYMLVVKHGLVFAFIVFRLLNLAVY